MDCVLQTGLVHLKMQEILLQGHQNAIPSLESLDTKIPMKISRGLMKYHDETEGVVATREGL